jgi:hypothetical protein
VLAARECVSTCVTAESTSSIQAPNAYRRGFLLALSVVGCGLPFFLADLAIRRVDNETYGSADPDPRTASIASLFGYVQIALAATSFAWGEWRKSRVQRANGDASEV